MSFLKDDKAYNKYLQPILNQQANVDLQSIKRMFLSQDNKEAINALWHCMKGNKPVSKDELYFLLKNDFKRNRIIRIFD